MIGLYARVLSALDASTAEARSRGRTSHRPDLWRTRPTAPSLAVAKAGFPSIATAGTVLLP